MVTYSRWVIPHHCHYILYDHVLQQYPHLLYMINIVKYTIISSNEHFSYMMAGVFINVKLITKACGLWQSVTHTDRDEDF